MGRTISLCDKFPSGEEVCAFASPARLRYIGAGGGEDGPLALFQAVNADGQSSAVRMDFVQMRAAIATYPGFPWAHEAPSEKMPEDRIANLAQLMKGYVDMGGRITKLGEDFKSDQGSKAPENQNTTSLPLLRNDPDDQKLEF